MMSEDAGSVINSTTNVSNGNPSPSDGERKKRRVISLNVKLDVVKRANRGLRVVDIGRALDLPSTTVSTIIKNSAEIISKAKSLTHRDAAYTTKRRDIHMELMEPLLTEWLESMSEQNVQVSMCMIKEKAKEIYTELKQRDGAASPGDMNHDFKASNGWFHRYKKRQNLRNDNLLGAIKYENNEAASNFPTELQKIIENGKYSPKQVFNVAETSLFWKQNPLSGEPRMKKKGTLCKPADNLLTLLVGGNTEGAKLKPLLVYFTENQSDLDELDNPDSPIMWRSQKRSAMSLSLFQEWLKTYFSPFVKNYCEEQNLANRALLVISSGLDYPVDLSLVDNVKIVALPRDTTTALQPMDQGVITTLKTYYLHRTLQLAYDYAAINGPPAVNDFWHAFDIKKAMEILVETWLNMDPNLFNSVWHNLWPACVYTHWDSSGLGDAQQLIMTMAIELGLGVVEPENVLDILESLEGLSYQELIDLNQTRGIEPEKDITYQPLPCDKLTEAFELIERGAALLVRADPNQDRAHKFRRGILQHLRFYNPLYDEKKELFLTEPQDVLDQVFDL